MKKAITTLLLTVVLASGFSQKSYQTRPQVQLNLLLEFSGNGNRFGLLMEYEIPLISNKRGNYQLLVGGFDEFFIKNENDIEGMKGNTLSHLLGGSVSHQYFPRSIRGLYVSSTLYAGWGYRQINARYVNPDYRIDRRGNSSRHYLGIGAYWKVGMMFGGRFGIHALGKTDFSRLIDRYQATLFERPGFMYGMGITYFLP